MKEQELIKMLEEVNILQIDRVRRKRKFPWWKFKGPYYESEEISYKEKVYTFLYNCLKNGETTQGELDWANRIMAYDIVMWNSIKAKFDRDYSNYIKNP